MRASRDVRLSRPLPPIDLEAPPAVKTATFALG